MGVNRRTELVDAGISLALQQRFQDLLASVETRSIADQAGVTTGSFFHHFRNRSHFAMAVADAFVELWEARVEGLRTVTDKAIHPENIESGRRAAADAEWERLVQPGATPILQHLLWTVRDQPICHDTSRTAGEVLRDGYDLLADTVEVRYQDGLRRVGREMLPPFTSRDLTVLITALAEGLQMRHGVDPDAIRDDLYTDALGAMLLGVTRPRVERADTVPAPELSTLESRLLVRRRSTPAEGPAETWRHIADAAAHLFVDRGPGDVRVSEVADAAGVSTTTVYHHFGTVTAVAASGWARHIPELEAIAAEPITGQEGAIRRIEQVLLRYVQLARQNRGATEALAAQVVTEAHPASDRDWPRRISAVVPLPDVLQPLVKELRTLGRLRRRIETERLARSLIHLSTMQALLFTDVSDERIVDETMSLIFDGALVAPSDA